MMLRHLCLTALLGGAMILVGPTAEAGYEAYPPDVFVFRSYSPDAAYPPPPIPDCSAMAARFGEARLWVGQFSGRRMIPGPDGGVEPYGARGCFLAEADCRRWLHHNTGYANSAVGVMSCRPARMLR